MYAYINNGQERIDVVDRAGLITPHSRGSRWIVWSTTRQVVLSEHSSCEDAEAELRRLADES